MKKPFLIDLVDLENTNSASVSQAINTSLFNVFDGLVPYNMLVLIVTDGASYMKKCCRELSGLYPNMIHCICLVHSLMRVAELMRYSYPAVDSLINEGKSPLLNVADGNANTQK